MKFKEFFSRYQFSLEGRHQMGIQQQENLQTKYNLSGAAREGYSLNEFISIRNKQMQKLHDAYVDIRQGKHNRLMGPRDLNDTSEEALRRVTGPNMTYNNGFIAVDQTDRSLLSSIVNEYSNKTYYGSLPYYSVATVVDNVEALQSIAEKQLGYPVSVHDITYETNILQTELAHVDHTYNNNTFQEYAMYNPPRKGFLNGMYNAIKKLADPEKYAAQQKRFDEQDVPGIE